MTPGKPILGASLDSSSASSEDESFSRDLEGTWGSTATEIILTDAEKKRQEIINGELVAILLKSVEKSTE